MSAKEYLKTIRAERLEIKQLEERIEILSLSLLPKGIRYDAIKVQCSPENKMEDTYSKIDMCEREAREHYRELVNRYHWGMSQVNRLEKPDYRQVLFLYYFDGFTMETVAEKMFLSVPRVYQLRSEGLEELENIWEEVMDSI